MQIKLVSLKFYNLSEIENFKQKYVCLSWFFFFTKIYIYIDLFILVLSDN